MSHIDIASTRSRPLATGTLYARYGKRALDLGLALAMLPLLVPIIAVLWALVRSDGYSGFFAHQRVGRNGRPFRCWKLRSMVPDAEARLAAHLKADPALAAEWARTQKLTHDPRVTRVGRILRRTSLDELPQIWNVIRGDMSFVGPRPVTAAEVDRYGLFRHVYLDHRPGITGLWQVFGRADGSHANRLQFDRDYSADLGLWLDAILILRTATVVVQPTGR